jgi:tetratricopeptide (TPR) repeat protein
MQAAAVGEQLERILQSKAFSRAGRLRKFLEYTVSEELAGNGGRLKEYQIGVDVFGRGTDFDPRIDTIVRVEAIKLRERLDAYFEDEGATEPIRISIPKGCYRPVFEAHEEQLMPILHDPEALYWQAKALIGKWTPDEQRRALMLLSQGTRRWPACAKLHALFSEAAAGATCPDIAFLAPSEGVPLMRQAARRALELDPSLGQPHFFGNLAALRLPDKSAVIAALARALALSPKYANLHAWAAAVLMADGRIEEALLHARQAERLEPESLVLKTRTALTLLYCRKFGAGIGYLRDILEVSPADYSANLWYSRALCYSGRLEEAAAIAGRVYSATGETNALAAMGYAEALAGHNAAAAKIASQLEACAKERYVRPTGLAAINVALGRMDAAAGCISAAIQEGDFNFGWSKTDRRWDPLRGKVPGL